MSDTIRPAAPSIIHSDRLEYSRRSVGQSINHRAEPRGWNEPQLTMAIPPILRRWRWRRRRRRRPRDLPTASNKSSAADQRRSRPIADTPPPPSHPQQHGGLKKKNRTAQPSRIGRRILALAFYQLRLSATRWCIRGPRPFEQNQQSPRTRRSAPTISLV